ncbi:MAG: 50S ribosomal protein L6 [Minisyncoccia bacterium]|jgi:large subunit ribosomal protein L6
MSRLIKKPIALPEGVTIAEHDEILTVKGPKGELTVKIVPGVVVSSKDGGVWIAEGKNLANSAMLGTTWALIRNAIEGVTKGFAKKLEIEGVGYRAAIEGKDIVLFLGYAQPVRVPVPDGIMVAVEKNTAILISGMSKEDVGQIAAKIRALKKPEPYKGKGIHYEGEVIRRKVGKKAGTTTA